MERENVPVVGVLRASQDAFGRALLDLREGRSGPRLMLERDDGSSGPAMQPEEFFLPHEAWPWWERQAVGLAAGAVLDLGSGAGRHSLHLQDLGHEVTAADIEALVDGTGWRLEEHLIEGADHVVVLRRRA